MEKRESIIVTSQKKIITDLKQFLQYIDNNNKRELVKLSLNFKHRRFKDDTRFAVIKTEDIFFLQGLRVKIRQAIVEEIEELEENLKRYEKR